MAGLNTKLVQSYSKGSDDDSGSLARPQPSREKGRGGIPGQPNSGLKPEVVDKTASSPRTQAQRMPVPGAGSGPGRSASKALPTPPPDNRSTYKKVGDAVDNFMGGSPTSYVKRAASSVVNALSKPGATPMSIPKSVQSPGGGAGGMGRSQVKTAASSSARPGSGGGMGRGSASSDVGRNYGNPLGVGSKPAEAAAPKVDLPPSVSAPKVAVPVTARPVSRIPGKGPSSNKSGPPTGPGRSTMGAPPPSGAGKSVSSKPGAAKPTSAFGKAFAAARSAGKQTFEFGGKSYNTKRADDKPGSGPKKVAYGGPVQGPPAKGAGAGPGRTVSGPKKVAPGAGAGPGRKVSGPQRTSFKDSKYLFDYLAQK